MNWRTEFEAEGAHRLWAWAMRWLQATDRTTDNYLGVVFLACRTLMLECDLRNPETLKIAKNEVKQLILLAELDDSGLCEPFVVDGEQHIVQLSAEAWMNLSDDEAHAGLRWLQGD